MDDILATVESILVSWRTPIRIAGACAGWRASGGGTMTGQMFTPLRFHQPGTNVDPPPGGAECRTEALAGAHCIRTGWGRELIYLRLEDVFAGFFCCSERCVCVLWCAWSLGRGCLPPLSPYGCTAHNSGTASLSQWHPAGLLLSCFDLCLQPQEFFTATKKAAARSSLAAPVDAVQRHPGSSCTYLVRRSKMRAVLSVASTPASRSLKGTMDRSCRSLYRMGNVLRSVRATA